ncbi:MAG: ABC transporter ATP-binding protein [Acidimicrobiales bacterium]
MTSAIEVHDLSKRFRLYQEKYTSLKERILHAGRVPHHDFWALRGIDLEVAQGETIGILGRNGSGKSTFLKCIAGVLKPTKGEIRLRGHLAAMLELGAGFQPELSGRDNIFLNASLLGMSRRDVEKSFDAIVAFAELEEFIDNQVRFYSSGMYVRLGFAVAVNVDPHILLVDEVLAVGDERFQQKCMERIHQFQREGRTIVVVSHAPDVMRQMCNRVAVINSGRLVTVGPPGEAIRTFREALLDAGESIGSVPVLDEAEELAASLEVASTVAPPLPPRISTGRRVQVTGSRLETSVSGRTNLHPGEPASVVVDLEVSEALDGVAFGCSVFAANGALIFDFDSGEPEHLSIGRYEVTFRFDSVPLLDGAYTVNIRVQDPGGGIVHARLEPAAKIVIENPGTSTGIVALPLHVDIATRSAGGSLQSPPGSSLVDQLTT